MGKFSKHAISLSETDQCQGEEWVHSPSIDHGDKSLADFEFFGDKHQQASGKVCECF